MKQSDGRGGDGGVHRGRSEDAAGSLRGPLRENSGDGDAAPTPRASATGLPARAPAGRPPMAPRVLERHRDAEEFPRERKTGKEEEEAKPLAVRPRGAPRERSEQGRDSASRETGQRSAATALGGRGRCGRHHDTVDCPRGRGDESPISEAGALVVRPHGARRECPEEGGASEAGVARQRSPTTPLGGRDRLGHHYNAVERPRESVLSSRESGALVVRARSAPQERPRPEGGSTSDRSAAGLQSPATAHLRRHHGGLVSPREREPRRAEGRPRGLQLEEHPCGTPSIRPEGSLGAPGKLWGFDADGVVSNDDVPQHRRGVSSPGANDSGKGRDKSNDLPSRRTAAKSTHKTSTAATVHDETSAELAPNGSGIQSLGSTEAGEGGSYDKPSSEPGCAAASVHPHPAHGDASIPGVQASQENAEQSEMVQGIISELLETKSILDVESVESWLLEKETDSTLAYFQTYASRAERTWYNQWITWLSDYMGNTSDLPHESAFKESYCDEIPEEDLDEIFGKIQNQNYNYKCEMNDLLKGSFIAMHSLKEFLCRSCLELQPGLEFSALGIILAAARCKSNLHALGAKIHITGIAVVKAFTGSPKVQNQALKLLSKLCGLHANTKRILDLGGFGCAIHVLRFSALGAEPAAQLVSILLESECSYPSIFKEHLPYHLVKAVGLGRVKDPRTIEDILLLASKVELSLTGFFDALKILKPGCRTKNMLFGMLSKMASAQIEED